MKIHKLKLRGIGPFADEYAIDFDALGRNGLFLLDGPTGAGKSTVIDAIVYALYGRPATDDGGERMVSDFLGQIKKSERPFIELVFTTSAGVYLVRREPDYQYINRNKKESKENGTARLERLSNEEAQSGELIANGPREVAAEAAHIVGLDKQQFLSTVVLAQGQFAQFLKADDSTRAAILQRVFATKSYETLQRTLETRAKEATKLREAAENAVRQAIAIFCSNDAVGLDAEELVQQALNDRERFESLVDAEINRLAEIAAQAAHESTALLASKTDAEKQLTALRAQQELIANKRRLLVAMDSLVAKQAEIDATRDELDRARAATTVWALLQAWETAENSARDSQSHWETVEGSLSPEDRGLELPALQATLTREIEMRARLASAASAEASLPRLRSDIERVTAEAEGIERAANENRNLIASIPAQREALSVALSDAKVAAADLDPAQDRLQAAMDSMAHLTELAAAKTRLSEAEERHETAAAVAAECADAESKVIARYRAGLAAELAGALTDDEPCLVCGSLEHPQPAARATGHVTSKDVDRASTERRNADDRVRQAAREIAEPQAEVARLLGLIGEQTPEQARSAVESAESAVNIAKTAQTESGQLQAQIKKLDTTAADLQVEAAGFDSRLKSVREQQHTLSGQLESARSTVDAGRGDFETVAARIATLDARVGVLTSATEALSKAKLDADASSDAARRFGEAMAEKGFDTADAVRLAHRLPHAIESLDANIRAHSDALASTRGQLEAENLASVDIEIDLDINGQSERVAAALAASAAASATSTRSSDQLATARSGRDTILAELDKASAVMAEAEIAVALGETAAGKGRNQLKIPLSNYVVISRFEDVVGAANQRLTDMSDGRYRLETVADDGGLNRRKGLGLRVYDDRTDEPRPPTTLSGGETFYVSLALALGLADVVQSEAGGIMLDSLFVDEGFGSLDNETLETVMNVLTRLGRGSRTVGLISHVEGMKRIPDRVDIRRKSVNGPSEIVQTFS